MLQFSVLFRWHLQLSVKEHHFSHASRNGQRTSRCHDFVAINISDVDACLGLRFWQSNACPDQEIASWLAPGFIMVCVFMTCGENIGTARPSSPYGCQMLHVFHTGKTRRTSTESG